MKKSILLALMPLMLIFACEKEEDESGNNQQSQSDNYFPKKIGNYWVYDVKSFDAEGNPGPMDARKDCLLVEKDTLINGNTYKYINHYQHIRDSAGPTEFTPIIERDSADCIIGRSGKISFSSRLIGDTISRWTETQGNTNDTLFTVYYVMQEASPKTVPAGTFDVLDRKAILFSKLFPASVNQPLVYHYYYAKDIGLVSFSYIYVGGGVEVQHKLSDYHLQ
ncbi:MAG: hypothetical protein ACOCPM_02090 [Bacteroidales bacterium]